MSKIREWLMEEESGQGMVEYALIIVLISVASFLALYALRAKIESRFFTMANALNKK